MPRDRRALTILTCLALSGSIPLGATLGAQPASPPPPAVVTTSEYLRTRDGTRLAVDVHLPADRASGTRLPALIQVTRYWRASEDATTGARRRSLGMLDNYFLSHGYAVVVVDARGSGASFGTRPGEYGPQEVRDCWDIVDWVAKQPWSSGAVGAYGTSYTGTTAELLAASNHPAVKAVVPGWSDFDAYESPARPYGLSTTFNDEWGALVGAMDRNDAKVMGGHVRRVDADTSGAMRDSAVAEHARNPDVGQWTRQMEFRDDHLEGGPSWEDLAPVQWKREIERSKVPMLVLVSWLDAGTAAGALDRLRSFRNKQTLLIMASAHGAVSKASPFTVSSAPIPNDPSQMEMAEMRVRFFDHYLKGVRNDVESWPPIRYFTLGAESYDTTSSWPLAGTRTRRLYLDAAHALSWTAPKASGRDAYTVDLGVVTGKANRWLTQMGRPILNLDDRGAMDARMLTYTTSPMARDLHVAGFPVLTVNVSSTHADGALIAYLEDVDETGRSRYITEGGLRLIDRRPAKDTVFGATPYHTFHRADAMPMRPGEPARVTFRILPTSVLIKRGHRLRLAIAGADTSAFLRVPATGTPTLTVHRGGDAAYLELPVVEKRER